MSTKMMLTWALLLCFGLCACAAPGAARRGSRETFDPLSLEDDDILEEYPYPEAPGSSRLPSTGTSEEAPGAATGQGLLPVPSGHQQAQGFRVQIFVSQDRTEAEEMKKKAAASFSAPAYVDFEPPWYKIRVGDYETEEQARAMLKEINAGGYAWKELKPLVVRTYIWKD